jgi:hypothetical protein
MTGSREQKNSEINMLQCHTVHHKSHFEVKRDLTRFCLVRMRRVAAQVMAQPLCNECAVSYFNSGHVSVEAVRSVS